MMLAGELLPALTALDGIEVGTDPSDVSGSHGTQTADSTLVAAMS